MRLIGVGVRKNITSSTDWNNPDIAADVAALIGANTRLTGREVVAVTGYNTNKADIFNEEYPGNPEFNSKTLELIAFSVDYTIQQRQICFPDPPSGVTQVTAFLLNQTTYDGLETNPTYYYLIDNDIP